MGVVWRARDELLDRDVAVKEVQVAETLTDDERANAYQRTLREAKTAARLSHPAVVSVFDVASDDGRPWIVMELIDSRSLDQVLASSGPMPARAVAEIGRQLLSALTVAHAAGVLHRDVKPSNVLIAGDGRAVLTDFGIATFQGDPKLTATGMVMGSPGFTAPERIRGGDATPASDLWSLGATLYAAVEGRGPYEARGGAITTMSAVINEDAPVAPSAGALEPVIASLLRRDPSQRPDAITATRMIGDVLPLLPDRPSGGGYQPTALATAAPPPAAPSPGGPSPGAPSPAAPSPAAPSQDAAASTRRSGGEAPPPDFSSWYSSSRSGERGSGWSAYQSGPPTPPGPGVPGPVRSSSGYEPARRGGGVRWALVLVILALLGAAAGVVAVILVRHNHNAGSPGTAGSGTAGSTPTATSPATVATPTSGGGGGGAPGDSLVGSINHQPLGSVPSGYTSYQLTGATAGTTAGFGIGYPSAGWSESVKTHSTYFRLSQATYAQVDLTSHTYPNDMLQEANYVKNASMQFHPGYHQIALARMTIRGVPGAYWEFTWNNNGVTTRWLDFMWVADTSAGAQSYAMLFSAPQSAWNQLSPTFAAIAQSFETVP